VRRPKHCIKYFTTHARVNLGTAWNAKDYQVNGNAKYVQGYKFALYYPELIKNHIPPRYKLVPDGKSADTELIRFIGGAPYADVYFRIARKDWDYNEHKVRWPQFRDFTPRSIRK
jgi:Cactus-binding C-terminus of cactin protein